MKINQINIGPLVVDKNDFLDWSKPRLEKLGMFLEKNTEKRDWKFLSIDTNIKYMKEGDERIKKLGRPYLFTHAPTKQQVESLMAFLNKNNICLDCTPSINEWVLSDKTEKELGE